MKGAFVTTKAVKTVQKVLTLFNTVWAYVSGGNGVSGAVFLPKTEVFHINETVFPVAEKTMLQQVVSSGR